MKKIYIIILISSSYLCGSWWSSYDLNKLGVITVPCTDMLMKAAGKENVEACYDAIPITNENAHRVCARVHQMLCNEVLFNLEMIGDEVRGSLPNAWLTVDVTGKPNTTLYTIIHSLRTLDHLKNNGIPLDLIPCPRFLPEFTDQSTIVLTMPWYCDETSVLYSAGTRFVRDSSHDTPKAYGIFVIDYNNNTYYASLVPKSLSFIEKQFNNEVKRTLFVLLVTRWATLKKGIIPYVWGGSSFRFLYKDTPGYFIREQNTGYWDRDEQIRPYSGFDCSELIWRAAQIVGLDFPYKNSGIMTLRLDSLETHDRIKEGDIIWIPGHVIIVTNRKKGLIVESAGYRSGYGKVHQISIRQRFKNICTFDDILHLYRTSQPITFLKKNGEPIIETPFKILKLF